MTPRLAALAFIALLIGLSPAAAQLSMGPRVPNGTKVPRQQATTFTPAESQQLATMMSHMSSKQRRRLNKTVNNMTPAQRQQFAVMVKRQLAAKGTASQAVKR